MEQINAQEERLERMNDSRNASPQSRRYRQRIIAMSALNARDNFNAGQYSPGGRIVVARRDRVPRVAHPSGTSQLQQALTKAIRITKGGGK